MAPQAATAVGPAAPSLSYEITHLWSGDPIPASEHHKINAAITLQNVANILTLSVVASFYEDPAPPKISKANKSYPNLWNYEIVEVFLYSTESNKYLQVLLSPHGHYYVLFSDGAKNHVDGGFKIDYDAKIDNENGTWSGVAKLPVELLPPKVDRVMVASVHGGKDKRQYETLYPIPGEKPDLHQPEHFGELDLESLFPGFRQQSELSKAWQKAIDNPLETHSVFYMWDGTPIENDHSSHNNQYCTFFFKGVDEGLSINVLCPYFDDPAPEGEPGPTDKLWEHEVAEAFFLAAYPNGTNRYVEIELGPHGHHIVLFLDGVRNAVAKLLPIQYDAVIDRVANVWVGDAIIPRDYFPPTVNKFMGTDVHNTGKTADEVRYEVVSPMPGPSANFHFLEKYISIDFENLLPGNLNSTMSQIWADSIAHPIPPNGSD